VEWYICRVKKFKENWEITQNWQLIYPVLGVLLTFGFALLIASRFDGFLESKPMQQFIFTGIASLILTYVFIAVSLFCFRKLKNRWDLQFRWQFIAVFMVFAITGSTAGKISSPVMNLIGLGKEDISGFLYWPLRILIIFPLYQILLLIVAWIFGQYAFFYQFEKKMLSRFGLGFMFKD
tara:strand:+ start:39418 stop:39954 length:537 start_codon:yes stop_codon:yes gene_type:complete